MSDGEEHERDVLQRARRALGPSSEDQSRVLAATLAGAALVDELPDGAATTTPALPVILARSAVAVFALGVAGAAGYSWGYAAGLAARSTPAVGQSRTLAKGAMPSEHAPPRPAPSATPALAPPADSSRAAARPVAVSSPPPAVAAPRSPPPAAEAGLDEEVRQLRRIERAIRDDNPRLALVISEDLDRSVPQGQLLLERRAASMMASCQLDVEGAPARAERFIADSAGSAYVARLRELCRLPEPKQRK